MSPSVYVVYTSLFTIPPGGENLDNHIGGDYKDVTRAYLPSDIMTLPGGCWDASFPLLTPVFKNSVVSTVRRWPPDL